MTGVVVILLVLNVSVDMAGVVVTFGAIVEVVVVDGSGLAFDAVTISITDAVVAVGVALFGVELITDTVPILWLDVGIVPVEAGDDVVRVKFDTFTVSIGVVVGMDDIAVDEVDTVSTNGVFVVLDVTFSNCDVVFDGRFVILAAAEDDLKSVYIPKSCM